MAFLSLYRKYRPNSFEDLVGQKHVVRTLKNALEYNRIAHAYLFAGPRGTGKTSTAKIYAQALNCVDGPTAKPCGHCETCKKIQSGQSIDVIEIDGASNRGIDEIRDLREKVKFFPSEGKYKVYIIDEVHMLTKGAFNALLKTLEEPPANVVFILATTEPHKIIDTILSRCQRFDFSLMSSTDIKSRLEYICQEEKIEYDQGSLNLITAASNGGLRDAISLLDQAISFTNAKLEEEEIQEMLGKVEAAFLKEFLANLIDKKTAELLEMLNEVINSGKGISIFVSDFINFLRQIILYKECGKNSSLLNFTDGFLEGLDNILESIKTKMIINFIEILSNLEKDLNYTDQPRIILEMAVLKMSAFETGNSLEGLKNRIQKLESALSSLIKDGVDYSAQTSKASDKKRYNSKEELNDKRQFKTNAKDESTKLNTASKKDDFSKDNDTSQESNPSDSRNSDLKSANKQSLLEIGNLKKAWSDILSQLRGENVSVQALLLEGSPVKVEGETIYINFPEDKNFHKKGAEKNASLIQKVIKNVLKVNCELVFFSGEEANRQSKKKKSEIINLKEDSFEPEKASDEESVVDKVLKMFNGQLIKVNHQLLDKNEK